MYVYIYIYKPICVYLCSFVDRNMCTCGGLLCFFLHLRLYCDDVNSPPSGEALPRKVPMAILVSMDWFESVEYQNNNGLSILVSFVENKSWYQVCINNNLGTNKKHMSDIVFSFCRMSLQPVLGWYYSTVYQVDDPKTDVSYSVGRNRWLNSFVCLPQCVRNT